MVFQTFYSAFGGRGLRVVARCFHIAPALAGVGVRVWMGLHGVRDPRQAGGYVGGIRGLSGGVCMDIFSLNFR